MIPAHWIRLLHMAALLIIQPNIDFLPALNCVLHQRTLWLNKLVNMTTKFYVMAQWSCWCGAHHHTVYSCIIHAGTAVFFFRAAFQYGVKMADGRKTRRAAGKKDDKAKLDRELQKINQVCSCCSSRWLWHSVAVRVSICGTCFLFMVP